MFEVEKCFSSRKIRSINFQFIDRKSETSDSSGETSHRKRLISERWMSRDCEIEALQLVLLGKISCEVNLDTKMMINEKQVLIVL